MTNAAKYGAAGEDVWVTVKGDADRVVATVCNMGEPLQEGALHGMFDPLRRGSSTAAVGEHTSLGLGLFIVREIVNAHGGEVTASSSNGKTEFTFSLPRHA
uniref:sensor histidine kinase n=1 Tax=Luteimonas sp. 4-12 TaxID=2027406 RepID=UPI001E4AAE6A|nr:MULTISPECIES: ATP-binding protein [Luteimonas]